MEKKDLKFYEAPAVELVEVELDGFLCESPTGGGSAEIPAENIDPGFGD